MQRCGMKLWHPMLEKRSGSGTLMLINGLEEFRQHLGGRLTLTMLRGVGDPIDVHQLDRPRMQQAIAEVTEFAAATAPG